MRSINNESRITMNSRRNFVNYATMTLSDGTVLHLTPSDFRIAGNSFTDDWVDGNDFQIGTAIGKIATLLLDNTDGRTEEVGSSIVTYKHGKFSEYDFYMAYFELYECLPNAYTYGSSLRDEMIPIGTFTVTTPTSHGATIEITGVDNMHKFDRSFDECDLDFSVGQNLQNILVRCCTDCGVAVGFGRFTNDDIVIMQKPEDATYRQVVSWIAQIAGCNAVIGITGALHLKSYDMSVFAEDLDGGTFLSDIGAEAQYMDKFTWSSGPATGYNIFYKRVPRSGKYRITRVVVSDIVDPSTFDGFLQIDKYNSFRDSVNNGTEFSSANGRKNREILRSFALVEGENVVNEDIEVSASNRINHWIGVGSTSGNGSKFSCTVYMMPLSYEDGDSADGGTFEPEWKYAVQTWTKSGSVVEGDMGWYIQTYSCPQYIGPAGKYKLTRLYIDNVVDISHFNAVYEVQKSTDNGTTWTVMQNGALSIGDNSINFIMVLPNSDETKFRVRVGQDIVADTDATEFKVHQYFKADDDLYLDGDNFDGGNFSDSLGYHNLTAITGTSISTDDIQFTGVQVINDEVSANYPTTSNWDYYALVISDNPLVAGNEAIIAQSIYNAIKNLKFRPFTTSSIQDPTIEAGDPCIVYDVKGNSYYSIITNVVFHTGGMTELSCNAEPPARQGSRYTSTYVYSAKKKTNDYSSQVAHFNEIANAALGYYKTEEIDAQTGATITYLHDHVELKNSVNVVKIASGIIAISDNYNTPQRSWNSGFDASTSTMLLNLIYVHGLTADWIHTGTLDVGGLNNIDGVIHVANRVLLADINGGSQTGTATISGSDTGAAFFVGPGQINISGTYRIFYDITNIEAGKDRSVRCYVMKRVESGGSYVWITVLDQYDVVNDTGEIPLDFEVDVNNGDIYYYIYFSRSSTSDAEFTVSVFFNKINTIIDKDGVSVRKGDIKLGTYNSSTQHHPFEATDDGKLYSVSGEIGGFAIHQNRLGRTASGSTGDFDATDISSVGDFGFSHDLPNTSTWTALMFPWYDNKLTLYTASAGAGPSGGGFVASGSSPGEGIGSNVTWGWNEGIRSDNYYVTWQPGSDKRLKEDIKPIDKVKEFFDKIKPVKFKFRHQSPIVDVNGKRIRYGVIAQDMEKLLNDIDEQNTFFVEEKDFTIDEETNRYKYVHYEEFHGWELAGIKDLYEIVQEQQKEIDELKARLDKLEGK